MPGTFGRDRPSVSHWQDVAAEYDRDLHQARRSYHEGRFGTADRLLAKAGLPAGARIVDFGCGEGEYGRRLAARGFAVTGIDPADHLIELARRREPRIELLVGGAGALAAAGPADAVVALNVLAYLSDGELARFWDGARAALAPGGVLLASHSNELFDLFALNAGTAGFFARHLTDGASVDELLGATASAGPYNVRANPLTLRDELATLRFEEVGRAYFNLHPLPPALLGPGDEGRVHDPEVIARRPEWKLQLQCSTLFSLARRM